MKVTFYFVRHGETYFNKKGRVQGVCDSPLTDIGEKQADRAYKALKDVYFDSVYCSPAGRCVQTTQHILNNRNMDFIVENNLHEFDFGMYEGTRFTSHPDEIQACMEANDFSSVNGESPQAIFDRIDEVMDSILYEAEWGDNILLVSHGYFEMMLLGHLLDVDVKEYMQKRQQEGRNPIPNAGIMKFSYVDGVGYQLEQLPIEPEKFINEKENKTIHFFFVNHGQTLFNKDNRMQGVTDSPLTERGYHEIESTCNALETMNFDYIYTSPMTRCIDTANMLSHDRNIEPVILDGLKEINYGEFEGIVRDSWLKEIQEHRKNHDDYSDVGGESQKEFESRVNHTLHKIVSSAKDETKVLLVGHSEYYKRLLEILFGLNGEETMMELRKSGKQPHPYGGIAQFDYINGEYQLNLLMETPEDFQKDYE